MNKKRAFSLSLIIMSLILLGAWAGAAWLAPPSHAAPIPTQEASTNAPLAEGFEGGPIEQSQFSAICQGAGCGWTADDTVKHSGAYAAHAPDLGNVADQRLTMIRPVALPADATSASLSFYQRYEFETAGTRYFDGSVLEISTDGGVTWADGGAHITSGGYNGMIYAFNNNPLAGRQGWTGNTGGAWVAVQANLLAYAGHTVTVRFELGTDNGGSAGGWWIDDVLISYQAPVPCGTPAWTNGTAYPTPLAGAAVVALNGFIYSFGGMHDANTYLSEARKYDPTTHIWTSIRGLPNLRAGASAATDGTYIYIVNGFSTIGVPSKSLIRYNPASNTYTTLASPATATAYQALVFQNGYLYRIGGSAAGGPTATMEYYVIAGNAWGIGLTLPHPLAGMAAALLNGHIYITGGNTTGGVASAHTYRYDPELSLWDEITGAPLPAPLGDVGSTVFNRRWIVVGGATAGQVSSGVYAFDPDTYRWASLSQTITPVEGPGVAAAGLQLFVVGGSTTTQTQATLQVYSEALCPTPAPSPTHTPHQAGTATPTATGTPPTATPTAPPCSLSFNDVHATDYFYTPVLYLACHGVVSGYADGTFRPFANTTRAQMVKIVVLGLGVAGYTPPGSAYTFADVPRTAPFWSVIEAAAHAGVVSGYGCGGAGEPCDTLHRPYFRPNAYVTRGQLAKIVVNAKGWILSGPPSASFTDVPMTSAFFSYVETVYCHGIISGYACGGAGEPCDAQHHPYFRPGANATRGQIAKIIYGTISGGTVCVLPQ